MSHVSNAQSSPVAVLLDSAGLELLRHHGKFSQTALFHRRVNRNESGNHLGSGYSAKSDSGWWWDRLCASHKLPHAAAAAAALRL